MRNLPLGQNPVFDFSGLTCQTSRGKAALPHPLHPQLVLCSLRRELQSMTLSPTPTHHPRPAQPLLSSLLNIAAFLIQVPLFGGYLVGDFSEGLSPAASISIEMSIWGAWGPWRHLSPPWVSASTFLFPPLPSLPPPSYQEDRMVGPFCSGLPLGMVAPSPVLSSPDMVLPVPHLQASLGKSGALVGWMLLVSCLHYCSWWMKS